MAFRRLFLLLLTAALCGLSGGPGRADDAKPPRIKAVTRFYLASDGRMYLQGQLEGPKGQTLVALLIDTGAGENYFSAATATKAGLPITTLPGTAKSYASDGKPWQFVAVPDLISDQFNLAGQTFYLLPAGQLPKRTVAAQVEAASDGILGASTLTQGALMFDYERDWMTFWYPGGLSQSDIAAEGFNTLYTVPISPLPGNPGKWAVHAVLTVGSVSAPGDLAIDTGSSETFVPAAAADKLKLKPEGSSSATVFLNKNMATDYDKVDRIQIGDYVVLNHRVDYATGKDSVLPTSVGVLGMDIFRGYAVLMDFTQGKMYLGNIKPVRPAPSPAPASPNASPPKEK